MRTHTPKAVANVCDAVDHAQPDSVKTAFSSIPLLSVAYVYLQLQYQR